MRGFYQHLEERRHGQSSVDGTSCGESKFLTNSLLRIAQISVGSLVRPDDEGSSKKLLVDAIDVQQKNIRWIIQQRRLIKKQVYATAVTTYSNLMLLTKTE